MLHNPRHKVVLIGDSMVGKTALLNRLTRGYYQENYNPTVGTGCGFWSTSTNSDATHLQIWDTAGQEKYKSLGNIFYRNASAAIFVFSQIDLDTATSIETWYESFKNITGTQPAVAIAANKCDLKEKSPALTATILKMSQWAQEKGFYFAETSAKSGQGVDELFIQISKMISRQNDVASNLFSSHLFRKPEKQQKAKKLRQNCC